jgi:hypothetical protein
MCRQLPTGRVLFCTSKTLNCRHIRHNCMMARFTDLFPVYTKFSRQLESTDMLGGDLETLYQLTECLWCCQWKSPSPPQQAKALLLKEQPNNSHCLAYEQSLDGEPGELVDMVKQKLVKAMAARASWTRSGCPKPRERSCIYRLVRMDTSLTLLGAPARSLVTLLFWREVSIKYPWQE